jgi:hypothetical protein
MTGRDVASVLRHWGQRRSEATCMMHVSQSIFWVPSNVIMYNGKTIPIIWLEDYLLVCRAGGAHKDLFII